jgi:hypothetical protein
MKAQPRQRYAWWRLSRIHSGSIALPWWDLFLAECWLAAVLQHWTESLARILDSPAHHTPGMGTPIHAACYHRCVASDVGSEAGV